MKIAILSPKDEFTENQITRLRSYGTVVFTETRDEHTIEQLLKISKNSDILAVDPDVCGGFEKAKESLTTIMKSLPDLKGVCLGTTSFGWIDLDYCRERKISVTNCPGWSRNSVAEQTITFILSAVRRVILTDRETQKGEYKLEMASEVNGKTLGIIGLGSIGSKVAELASGIGMKVIAYNSSPRNQENVEMKSLDEVLSESDVIALHITHTSENENLINIETLKKIKKGVVFVNLADRTVVNETAMAEAIKDGRVNTYMFELEEFDDSPLSKLKNVIMMKPFAWFTKEALDDLMEIWTSNIESMAVGKPINVVE